MSGILLITALVSTGTIAALLHRIDYLEDQLAERRRWEQHARRFR